LKDEMLYAIKKEIFLRKNELENKTLKSLYFGGGTPSILDVDDIKKLMDDIQKYFDFDDEIEITLEANPDDLTKNFLSQLSQTAVNRLSIGVQSFCDEDLKMMNRAHNASQSETSVKCSQDFGFQNISIDLIYGSPISDFKIWTKNLDKTIELQVPHISSYALTIEPKTALENWITKGKIPPPKEDEQSKEFYYMSDFLEKNGFLHYEISNFGKPNFHSRHNSNYWKHREYLGIGPSAHSFDGHKERSWNISNNSLYIKNLKQNILPKETEKLSENQRFNEFLMLGLRTVWGVDLSELNKKFSEPIVEKFNKNIRQKISDGVLIIENNHLKISEKHWFFADGIAADLFVV
jgi:oxygen-independent coproporphyrinogen-3 oxidase